MNQINKKCFMASAAFHALLFLVLLVGPAFFVKKKLDEPLPTLEVLPSKAIDQLFYQPAPPAPPTPKPKPKPVEQTPKPPEPKPAVKKVNDPPKPPSKPKYNSPDRIQVNKNRRVSESRPPVNNDRSREAEKAAERIRSAAGQTTITVPKGSVSFANHAQLVKSKYRLSWSPPSGISKSSAVARVKVVIHRDGLVMSSSLIGSSGDPAVDASIRDTLRRVTRVAAFPSGATEETRTYIIGFQLEAK